MGIEARQLPRIGQRQFKRLEASAELLLKRMASVEVHRFAGFYSPLRHLKKVNVASGNGICPIVLPTGPAKLPL